MQPQVEGTMRSADGYWLVEVLRYGRHEHWLRVTHGTTVLGDRFTLATVQRMLGDAYGTLQPVDAA